MKTGFIRAILNLMIAVGCISCAREQRATSPTVNTYLKDVDSLVTVGSVKVTNQKQFKDNLVKASSILKKAKSLEPSNLLINQLQARTYTYMRIPDSVILVYTDWLKIEPKSLEAKLKRGLLYKTLNRENNAKLDFVEVKTILAHREKKIDSKLSSDDINSLINDSFTYYLIGEIFNAKSILLKIHKVFPTNIRAKNALLRFNNLNRKLEIFKQIGF